MNKEINSIVGDIAVGCLATVSTDGSPWTTPVHAAFDEENLYWMSSPDTLHSKNIDNNDQICFSIWSPDTSDGLRGVYIKTRAQKLSDQTEAMARKAFKEKYGQEILDKFSKHAAYGAPIGQINHDKTVDNCKYFNSDKTLQVVYDGG